MADLSLIPQNRIKDLSTTFNGCVHTTGNETIAGVKTFTDTPTIKMTQPNLNMQYSGISKGTAPTSTLYGWFGTVLDKNGPAQANKMAQIYHQYDPNGRSSLNLQVFEPTSGATNGQQLSIGYDANKNIFTSAPTPATSDNSTKIATTSYVRNCITDILGTLYPVGSTYITTASTCPLSTLISGSTWTKVSEGRVLQGSDSSHNAGTTIEPGLPNVITGSFGTYGYGSVNEGTVNGIGTGSVNNNCGTNGGSGGHYCTHWINLSSSNSIYGNSTTVQPPAYVVNIFKRTA